MSKGPGRVERAIAEALRDPQASNLSTTTLCQRVFQIEAQAVTKAHRVSVLRAVRRVLERDPSLGWRVSHRQQISKASPDIPLVLGAADEGRRLHTRRACVLVRRSAARPKPVDVSEPIWAYRHGLGRAIWAEATIVRLTPTRTTILFKGQKIVADSSLRPIGQQDHRVDGWSFTRDRAGTEKWLRRIYRFDREQARERLGEFGSDQTARELLDLGPDYTKADVERAFRECVHRYHADHGGDDRLTRTLLKARTILRAQLGEEEEADGWEDDADAEDKDNEPLPIGG